MNRRGFFAGLITGALGLLGVKTAKSLPETKTFANWKTWTTCYTTLDKDDMIRRWREAAKATVLHPPVGEVFGISYWLEKKA